MSDSITLRVVSRKTNEKILEISIPLAATLAEVQSAICSHTESALRLVTHIYKPTKDEEPLEIPQGDFHSASLADIGVTAEENEILVEGCDTDREAVGSLQQQLGNVSAEVRVTRTELAALRAELQRILAKLDGPASADASGDLRQQRLFAKFLGLVDRVDWKKGSVVEGCQIETCVVDYSNFNALRISTHFNCSLETFRDFLKEESNVRKYDVALDTFQVLKTNPESVILYTNYKRQSRMVAPRDFVTESTTQMFTPEEAAANRLTGVKNEGVFVQSTVSVSGFKDPVKDWVRGNILAFGYLAIAEGPKRIQVYNYACVDPAGGIPKFIADATSSMSAKTVAQIRGLCEEAEKKKN
eukprot:GILI01011162.1.p2 GENE.GILI01011162.1~~GILI01011162.1.p2  ORF type:complete len:357 (+),score=135.08 GILI01011162.1:61-1131(+)